jgi:hydrogenase maturation protease
MGKTERQPSTYRAATVRERFSSFVTPPKPPVLVLGVGKALLGDGGAGLLVLAESERDAARWGGQVEFLDGGSQGLALLDRIAGRRASLVLDAVALGTEPGTVHVLRRWKHAGERAFTAHESNVAELLQASTLPGECPEQVTVIGIEPARIETRIGGWPRA